MLWDPERYSVPAESERILDTICHVPPDVRSVLDVGCGNGTFLKALLKRQLNRLEVVVGVDRSRTALGHVAAPRILATITHLPIRSRTFELVACQEVLEHLPHRSFSLALGELARVSSKWILITVPNAQDLASSTTVCPSCQCAFNPQFHMRSFDSDTLKSIFKPNFECLKVDGIGPVIRYRLHDRRIAAWYRAVRRPAPPSHAVCPQCGFANDDMAPSRSLTAIPGRETGSRLKSFVKRLFPTAEKNQWILGLFRRRQC